MSLGNLYFKNAWHRCISWVNTQILWFFTYMVHSLSFNIKILGQPITDQRPNIALSIHCFPFLSGTGWTDVIWEKAIHQFILLTHNDKECSLDNHSQRSETSKDIVNNDRCKRRLMWKMKVLKRTLRKQWQDPSQWSETWRGVRDDGEMKTECCPSCQSTACHQRVQQLE